MTVSTAEISSNDLNNGAAFLEFAAAPAALPAIAAPPAKNERLAAAKRQRLYAHGVYARRRPAHPRFRRGMSLPPGLGHAALTPRG